MSCQEEYGKKNIRILASRLSTIVTDGLNPMGEEVIQGDVHFTINW